MSPRNPKTLLTTLLTTLASAACALLISASPSMAQTKLKTTALTSPTPASALYVGNSFFYYNNSMHGHVSQLVAAGMPGYKFRTSSVTISGSGFDWHDVGSYFRPRGIGTYSFDAKNNVVFNDPKEKLFEIAILMDCSQCPIHPTLKPVFQEYAKKHSDTVRQNGAQPRVFYVLGLRRRARDDRHPGRGLHPSRQ
jgi:hypothetical protein